MKIMVFMLNLVAFLNKRLVSWKLKRKAEIKPRSVDAGRRKKVVAAELAALLNKWQL